MSQLLSEKQSLYNMLCFQPITLVAITNQQLFEKHLYDQSSHYENYQCTTSDKVNFFDVVSSHNKKILNNKYTENSEAALSLLRLKSLCDSLLG